VLIVAASGRTSAPGRPAADRPCELGFSVEQAPGLERIGDFESMTAHAADIRKRREHPDGRCMERDDAKRPDDVAGGPAG
jgi:hypothetical protein